MHILFNILGYSINVGQFKMIEIMQNIFSDYNGIKWETEKW
jgi:hypothetical protein